MRHLESNCDSGMLYSELLVPECFGTKLTLCKNLTADNKLDSSFGELRASHRLQGSVYKEVTTWYLTDGPPAVHARFCQCAGSRLPWKQAMTVCVVSSSMTNIDA